MGRMRTCIIVSARSCAHGKWSVRLADRLSQGDFWPAETHRDPRRTVLNFLLLFAITTQWFSPQPSASHLTEPTAIVSKEPICASGHIAAVGKS
jgi:hypothetical protein